MTSLVVIGASAGGLSALARLTAALPADLAAPVLVVLHIGPHDIHLPSRFSSTCRLPVKQAEQGELLRSGWLYVAPPDHHLMVIVDRCRLTRGPKENHCRPAIDPLFRSAAQARGTDVIGVVLTGMLHDGTAGLQAIKRSGGVAVVQHPDDAEARGMPESAMQHVEVDHCVTLARMPALLASLAGRQPSTEVSPAVQTVPANGRGGPNKA